MALRACLMYLATSAGVAGAAWSVRAVRTALTRSGSEAGQACFLILVAAGWAGFFSGSPRSSSSCVACWPSGFWTAVLGGTMQRIGAGFNCHLAHVELLAGLRN